MRKIITLLLVATLWSCVDNDEVETPKYPTVDKITEEPIAAGSTLTITGRDVDDDPVFIFNGEKITPISIKSSSVTLRIPEEAMSGKLEIKFKQEEYNTQFFLKILDKGWSSSRAPSYSQIKFISPLVGFGRKVDGTFNYINKTVDGGLTWVNVSKETTSNSLLGVVSENVMYVKIASNKIKKTVDGGVSWEEKEALSIGTIIKEMFFKNEEEGFLLAGRLDKSYIYKTEDGGNTWILKKEIDTAFYYMKLIHFEANNIKLLNEESNTIVSTIDGANTWEEEELGITPTYTPIFDFVNEDNVWMSMIDRVDWTGGLFNKVSNGSWKKIELPKVPSYEGILNVTFFDENKGCVLTKRGGIFYTNDGGDTWRLFYLNTEIICSVTQLGNKLYVSGFYGDFHTKTIN